MAYQRHCTCERFTPGQPWARGDCRYCWMWNDPGEAGQRFRAGLVKGAVTPGRAAKPTRRLPCVHLGEPTGELRGCTGCGGRKLEKLKVFHCDHPAHDGVTAKDCKTCRDYAPVAPLTP